MLVTQKKLKIKQGKKSVTRRTSISENFGLSFKSSIFQTRVASHSNLEQFAPVDIKKVRTTLSKFKKNDEILIDKEKTIQRLYKSTQENEDADLLTKRKGCLHYLIKLAKKLRGSIPGHDGIIEEEASSNKLSEPQYGGELEIIDTNQSEDELDEMLLDKKSGMEEVKEELRQKQKKSSDNIKPWTECDFLYKETEKTSYESCGHRSQISNVTVGDIMNTECSIMANKSYPLQQQIMNTKEIISLNPPFKHKSW